jgi:hypothetical protein
VKLFSKIIVVCFILFQVIPAAHSLLKDYLNNAESVYIETNNADEEENEKGKEVKKEIFIANIQNKQVIYSNLSLSFSSHYKLSHYFTFRSIEILPPKIC